MPNKPYDRVIINPFERPASIDINRLQSQSDRSVRDMLQRLLARAVGYSAPNLSDASAFVSGCIGDGLVVRPESPASMNVVVRAGLGFLYDPSDVPSSIGSVAGLDDLSAYKPLFLSSDETITVPAADAVNPRIDLVEVRHDYYLADSSSRDILNTGTGVFAPGTVDKTLSFDLAGRSTVNGAGPINYKTGTPAAVPVVPTLTAGYIRLAAVSVPALAASIADSQLSDLRKLLAQGGWNHASVCFSAVTSGGMPQIPTIEHLIAPPGVKIVVTTIDTAAGECVVRLFAGHFEQVVAVAQCAPQGWPGEIFVVQQSFAIVDDVEAADVTAITDATVSRPLIGSMASNAAPFSSLTGANGAKVASLGVLARKQAAGVTNNGLPGVFQYSVHFMFR